MPVKSTQRGDFPQTEFTSAEDANITWGPQTGWPVWGDAAPVSMPTDNKVSSITPAPSADSSSPPPPRGGVGGCAEIRLRRFGQAVQRSGELLSLHSAGAQAFGQLELGAQPVQSRGQGRGLAARPHSLAKRPYFSAAVPSAALKMDDVGQNQGVEPPMGR